MPPRSFVSGSLTVTLWPVSENEIDRIFVDGPARQVTILPRRSERDCGVIVGCLVAQGFKEVAVQ